MRISFLLAIWMAAAAAALAADYFPPPDSKGGWRNLSDAAGIERLTGISRPKLDEAFRYVEQTTKNGGLLVVRNGYLVYERYFGQASRETAPNSGSCGKSITSIAMGILMGERPQLFPRGLDEKVFTRKYLPQAFPLSDPEMAGITLGQLLAMTAGIRGNNPGYVNGVKVTLDPAGPDGWLAMKDEMALGHQDGPLHTKTLWVRPGGGYSYSTSSIHIVSIILRNLTGREMQQYVEEKLARPLGWGRWAFAYKDRPLTHTPGGGGAALRATDMMRFAYLLLREGKWNNKQIVPAGYVRHCGRLSPFNPHFPYSLQFDVNAGGQVPAAPRDAYWKSGSGGHAFYIVPSLDLIVWKLGGRDEQYDSRNTGLPEPPGPKDTRPGFRATIESNEALLRTLELVSAAVLRK